MTQNERIALWNDAAENGNVEILRKGIRQGDVRIRLTPASGLDFSKMNRLQRENGLMVVAHGEATNHIHVLEGEDVEVFEPEKSEFSRYMVTETGSVIRHIRTESGVKADHDDILVPTAPAGFVWEVKRQREFDEEEDIRMVYD